MVKGTNDTKYFLEQGYIVDVIDGSLELCKAASEYTGITIKHMLFQNLSEIERYGGIWACASILHVKREELPEIMRKMSSATKADGIIYLAFKYGDFPELKVETKNKIAEYDKELHGEKMIFTQNVPYKALPGFANRYSERIDLNSSAGRMMDRIENPLPYTFGEQKGLERKIIFEAVL